MKLDYYSISIWFYGLHEIRQAKNHRGSFPQGAVFIMQLF